MSPIHPNHRVDVFAYLALAFLLAYNGSIWAESPPVAELQIRNAKTPIEGVTSGGQPTEDELHQAAELGYQTVVNLRTEAEEMPFDEAELVESLGMHYVSLPVAGSEGINAENARALAEVLDRSARPILLHCGSGNRVGALFALKAYAVDGKDAATALQVGRDAGLTRLEPVVREKLGLPVPETE